MAEREYNLPFEKSYYTSDGIIGSVDSYQMSIVAQNDAEALREAQQKLVLHDMRSSYNSDITNAYLITPEDKKLLIPRFSRELREKEEMGEEISRILRIIENKTYGLRREDGTFNRDCDDFRCDGEFTEVKSEYDFIAVSCTKRFSHIGENKGWFSFRNGQNLEEKTARVLHELRGTKEDTVKKFKAWMRTKWYETKDAEDNFEKWLKRKQISFFV